ncbi:unnamed protein product [Pedinophyceae sp. YPF-701]|nr:unnamed protein product [Pedinophyceae sp. YPF-701]
MAWCRSMCLRAPVRRAGLAATRAAMRRAPLVRPAAARGEPQGSGGEERKPSHPEMEGAQEQFFEELDWLSFDSGAAAAPEPSASEQDDPADPDADDAGSGHPPPLGPLAVLLVGFPELEISMWQGLMNQMEADMVKLLVATKDMLEVPLSEALEAEQPAGVASAALPWDVPRTVVLSGMYQSEVIEVCTAYHDSGMPDAAFCCAVPRNYGRNLKQLVYDVHEDHAAAKQMYDSQDREA